MATSSGTFWRLRVKSVVVRLWTHCCAQFAFRVWGPTANCLAAPGSGEAEDGEKWRCDRRCDRRCGRSLHHFITWRAWKRKITSLEQVWLIYSGILFIDGYETRMHSSFIFHYKYIINQKEGTLKYEHHILETRTLIIFASGSKSKIPFCWIRRGRVFSL